MIDWPANLGGSPQFDGSERQSGRLQIEDIADVVTAAEDDGNRSRHIRRLVQAGNPPRPSTPGAAVPRVLVRFWHDGTEIPDEVQECLDSWRPLGEAGFRLELFDDERGRRFIETHFGNRQVAAFDRCLHPAMRCDYFRLCYLVARGGFYVDADEMYQGGEYEWLVDDDRLKVQPLCYDCDSNEMVDVSIFIRTGAESLGWIHYVNNNPLIAPAGHPVLVAALARSTRLLEVLPGHRLDIQSTTGPGNLTASLVAHALTAERASVSADFVFLTEWGQMSVSRWPMSYRSDERNWRLWDPSA